MKKCISIVVPVFNEEENIPLIYDEFCRIFRELKETYNHEIIFIDDGSHDSSWQHITELVEKDKNVRGLSFSRNFGHQCALEAGLLHARGDAIITIDADLEHPPSLIPELISKWEEGSMVVNAKRRCYQGRKIKNSASNFFYWFINKVSEVRIEPGVADYRLLDRHVVDEIAKIQEGEHFYRGLVQWIGLDSSVVEYESGVRQNGTSGYSLSKMIALGWTALTSFSTMPMRAIMFLGSFITGASWILLLIMVYVRFITGSDYFSEMAFLVVFIIGSNGIVLIALGILAIYMLRIHQEVQRKPNFILRRTLNLER